MRILARLLKKVRESFSPPMVPSLGEVIAAKSGGIRDLEHLLSEIRHDLPHHFEDFCRIAPDGEELLNAFCDFRGRVPNASSTSFAISLLTERGVEITRIPKTI